ARMHARTDTRTSWGMHMFHMNTPSTVHAIAAGLAGLLFASSIGAQTLPPATRPTTYPTTNPTTQATTKPAAMTPAVIAPTQPAEPLQPSMIASGLDKDGVLRLAVDKNSVITTVDPY